MPRIPVDSLPAAQFLLRNLYRPIELAPGRSFHAVSETEIPMGGDDWLWADDNAKVLEFVSRPEIWRRFPREPAELLRFVEAMCRGPFIFRRVSSPRLERVDGTGPVGNFVHSLMNVRSELPRGVVMAGIRFHDGRTADNLVLAGNAVEFTHRRRRISLNVDQAISEATAEQQGDVLTLRHSGELYFKRRWSQARLGRITYNHTIDARSMLIGVEAVLEVDPDTAASDVVLTIAQDNLSHGVNDVRYNSLAAQVRGGPSTILPAKNPGRVVLPFDRPSYYSIGQSEIAGFALCIHSAPRTPERLRHIEVSVRDPGWLHLVRARYQFDGPCRGARLAVGEDKILTAGGFYQRVMDYDALLQYAVSLGSTQSAVMDYSVSYDYGAEINAFAKCFAVCVNENLPEDFKQIGQTAKNLFDTYLQVYEECFVAGHRNKQNTIMSRQLAFVILGVVTMYRVTGAKPYLDRLRQLTDVLLDFEVRFDGIAGEPASGFPYGMHSLRNAWVDGQSSSLLALTLASRYIEDARFIEAIDRGVASYVWETCAVNQHKIDVVSTAIGHKTPDGEQQFHTENSYWNFNVGLALRFFNALRASSVPALRAVAAKYRDRIELFEMVLHRQIERSITERGDAIEIRTSIYSGETNSETQPWVMLGLLGHPYD